MQDTTHTSQNSLDWEGLYSGVIPCADCPGIEMSITLHADQTFSVTTEYQERDVVAEDKGKFSWENNGSTIHLQGITSEYRFKVGENRLIGLDADGNEIGATYVLEKEVN